MLPKDADGMTNSVDPDQTAPVWSYTVCNAVCILWMQYSMVKPPCSNFRVITANFSGVWIFRIFTVYGPPPLCRLRVSRYYHLCQGDFSLPTFFSVFLCISTPSMSKTVNLKQRVSWGDFSCPRRILHYICYCLCRSENRRSHGRNIVCFGYVHVLAEVRTSSKQQ